MSLIEKSIMDELAGKLVAKREQIILAAYERKFGEKINTNDKGRYVIYEQDGMQYFCRDNVCFYIECKEREIEYKKDERGGMTLVSSIWYNDEPKGIFCFFLEDHLEVLRTKLTPAEAAEIIRTHLNDESLD